MSSAIFFVALLGLEFVLLVLFIVLVTVNRSDWGRAARERRDMARRLRVVEVELRALGGGTRSEAQRQRDFYTYGIEEGT
jgi:hypothetical protein